MTEQTKNDLCTPQWLTDRIAAAGPIVLDPCGNQWSTVPASETWQVPERDGLAEPWAPGVPGIVFVNPPYGRGFLRKWARKSVEASHEDGRCVALLIPCDPSTKAWRIVRERARVIVYFAERIKFAGPLSKHAAEFPSALILLGDQRLCLRIGVEFVELADVRVIHH